MYWTNVKYSYDLQKELGDLEDCSNQKGLKFNSTK